MNRTIRIAAIRLAGATTLALLAGAAVAQSQIVRVDALANCVNVFSTENAPNPLVLRNIEAGTYAVKVKSSTADFCDGGGCPHPDVALTIYANPYIDDTFVVSSKATKLTFTDPVNFLGFYFPDSNCGDNTGHSVIQLTKLD